MSFLYKLSRFRLEFLLLQIPMLLFMSGCVWAFGVDRQAEPAQEEEIELPLLIVGSKSFTTEQILYGKLTSLYLRKNGFQVKEMAFRDSIPIRNALEAGVIDLCWDYTNTARILYQHEPAIMDAKEAYRRVAHEDRQIGLIWLQPSSFESPWIIFMKKELSNQLGISTISQLSDYVTRTGVEWKAAAYEEFLQRKDGKQRLDEVYGFNILPANWFSIENSLVFQAVKESRVQIGVGIALDGRMREYNLTILKDDRQAFPPYQAVPVVREQTLRKHSVLKELINKLSNSLTAEKFMELTYQVDSLHKDVTQVALDYLKNEGLIPSVTS